MNVLIKKHVLFIYMIVTVICLSFYPTYAEDLSPEKAITQNVFNEKEPVSLDKVLGLIDKAGEGIFAVLQKAIQWVAIIAFGFFLIKGLFALFGGGDMLPQCLIGCTVALIVYSIVYYIPDILNLAKEIGENFMNTP